MLKPFEKHRKICFPDYHKIPSFRRLCPLSQKAVIRRVSCMKQVPMNLICLRGRNLSLNTFSFLFFFLFFKAEAHTQGPDHHAGRRKGPLPEGDRHTSVFLCEVQFCVIGFSRNGALTQGRSKESICPVAIQNNHGSQLKPGSPESLTGFV
jgi:hypothetical protein